MTLEIAEHYSCVGQLIQSSETISPLARVSEVADRFFACPELEALALVEDYRPCGLAIRDKILGILFNRFGFELFGRDPIREIADPEPMVVQEDMAIEQALSQAMSRPYQDIYDEIVVVDGWGRFKGILSVKQMVIEQGNAFAQSVVQRELALARAGEMQKITDIKSQFIAHVTHELRSPVNAIVGLTEIMGLALDKGKMDALPEKLTHMSSCAANLRTIITNILDLSKIEAGRMEVSSEPFDLVDLLQETAATTRILLGDKPVAVEVVCAQEHLEVETDEVKLRQVLINLLSNAAKFTERGKILVTGRLEAGGLLISVEDTGIGIRGEDLEKLFTAFAQVEEAQTKKYQGTGLGLTITRQMLQLLGGQITVSSIYGRGTVFTIQLPPATSHMGKVANQ